MSKDAIMRLKNTVLYEQLVLKEENDHQLSELVKKIVANVAPILATVGSKMPEFTLHDVNHSAKVVELMSRIIPEDVLQKLNIIELTLLILSGYIHDVGMTCSSKEQEEIINNDSEYKMLIIENIDKKNLLKKYEKEHNHRALTIVENQLFTEYLRKNHVKRSRKYIIDNLSKGDLLLNWNETPLYKYLISICDSHELPVEFLNDIKRWPRKQLIRNVRVNIQYLSLILRLADILDLDPERTPKSILEFTNPKDPKSILEWKKHRSMIGWDITPEHIEFSAECTDPNCERVLREFLGWIEIERRDSLAITLKYNDDISKKYRLDLNEPVMIDEVKSNGSYIYSDLRFKLDYRRVLDILMGQRLYKNPCVALRELLQNAFDTMKYRNIVEEDEYNPKVKVILEDGYLIVEDNGMGMDENIFKKYFINVGKSYYSSSECKYGKDKLDVTSEFGIGILSVFMIAESIVVESRKRPDNPLQPPQPILVEIPKAHEYFIQRKSTRRKIGTEIKLKLKNNSPISRKNLIKLIKELVPFPKYPIKVDTKENMYTYEGNNKEELEEQIEKIIHKIPFGKSDEEENGIDGLIYIVSGKCGDIGIDYYGNKIVAQKGFKIGLPMISSDDYMQKYNNDSMGKLFPQWINVIPFINLSKTCTLTLTPDRSDVVIDSQFMKVKRQIENKIIESMKLYLKDIKASKTDYNYLNIFNDFLEMNVIKGEAFIGFEISKNGIEFILDNMPLLILDTNGQEHIVFGREIINVKSIVIISENNITGIKERIIVRQSINKYLGNEVIAIINQKNGDYSRKNLFEYIYGKFNGQFISGVEGITCSLITKREKNVETRYIDGKMEFTDNFFGKNRSEDILLSFSSEDGSFMIIIYNMNHPIFTPFNIEEGINNKEYKKLLLELDDKIKSILYNGIEQISKITDDIDWLREKENNDNFNFSIIHIFDKLPNLIEKLNYIFLEFWEKGKKIGAIEENLEFPSIDRDDFPWFW